MKSVVEVLKLGTEFLISKNIPEARINMQWLMCDVLGYSDIELYLNHDKPLYDKELNEIRCKMLDVAKNKPIQYVISTATFRDLQLELDEEVLIPRPETEELVELILKSTLNRFSGYSVLDIGTGSACIALSIAKAVRDAKVYAVDISENAIKVAKKNANRYLINNLYLHKLDILRQIPKTKFDLIVSNPPYIPIDEYYTLDKNVLDYEPKEALTDGADGLTFYRRFSEVFPVMLNPGGKFFLEIGYGQAAEIEKLFSVTNFETKVYKDMNGVERFIEGMQKQ